MHSIIEQLEKQHKQCEKIFCTFEDFVANENWQDATVEWKSFVRLIKEHFSTEETQLFPTMEKKWAKTSGNSPVGIFIVEHAHLLNLIQELDTFLSYKNKTVILEFSDLLMMNFQEHTQREEKNLFPMLDSTT